MKSVFTTLLLCASYICLSQNGSSLLKTSFDGFHCDGKPGLCSIDNVESKSLANTNATIDRKKFTMVIERRKLSNIEIRNLFNLQSVILDESKEHFFQLLHDFPLPYSITEGLELAISNRVLKKGLYPIQISQDYFTIIFNLE